MLLLIPVFALFALASSQCIPSSSFPMNHDSQNLTCSDYEIWDKILPESLLSQDHQRTIDFTFSATHPFVLDFPLKYPTEKNTYQFLMRFFDLVFLNAFQKFSNLTEATFMLATHPNQTSGLKIYVVGTEVSHADYQHFCYLLQDTCSYEEGEFSVYLNCSSVFSWPSCREIESNETENPDFFMPARLVHVQFEFYQENCTWLSRRLKNILYPQPEDSSKWISLWKKMIHNPNVTHLHFPTQIAEGWKHPGAVAIFESHLNKKYFSIVKENILVEGKNFDYDFIKENIHHISFQGGSQNTVLEKWYDNFQQPPSQFHYFLWIDNSLRKLCPHLKNETSPLETILKAYERPVYYALYNLLLDKEDVQKIHKQFPFLSKDLPAVPPKEAEYLTYNTILYCAYLTGNDTFIGHLGTGYDWIIKTIASPRQLIENILWIQRKTYPVIIGEDRKTSEFSIIPGPKKVFWWDTWTQNWKEMDDPVLDIQDILRWSMEILNTYSELPSELMKQFEEEWSEKVAYIVLSEANEKGEKKQHNVTESFDIYGHNVPEYYFLNYVAKSFM